MKVSALKESGYSSQRPKLVPIGSPFKNRESYYILYKDFAKERLSDIDKRYIRGVVEQGRGNYEGALVYYEGIYSKDNAYKDVGVRIGESYLGLAEAYKAKDVGRYISLLNKSLEYSPNSLFVLNWLGRAYISTRAYDSALAIFKKVLDISGSNNDYFFVLNAHNSIGFIYYTRGALSTALKHFKLSLEMSKGAGDLGGQAVSNNYIGALYLRKDDREKALYYFEETKRVSELSGDSFSLASALNNIALMQVSEARYESALSSFLEVLGYFESLSAEKELVVCRNNIAFTYRKLGKYKEALRYYDSSLKFYKRSGDIVGQVDTMLVIAGIYSLQASYKRSLSILLRAEKLIGVDDVYNRVRIFVSRGSAYAGIFKYKAAVDLLVRAKVLAGEAGYTVLAISATIELSVVYESLISSSLSKEDYDGAIRYLQEVLLLYKELDNIAPLIARTYASIGYVYYKQGRYSDALSFLDKALSVSGGSKESKEELEASVLSYMANVLLAMGIGFADEDDYAKAFEHFNRSLEVSRSLGDARNAAKTALTIAAFHEKLGQSQDAVNYYKIAIDLFTEANDLFQLAKVYHRLGVYYSSSKEEEKAYDNLKQAFVYIDGYMSNPLYKVVRRDFVYSTNLVAVKFYKMARYKLASIYYMEAYNFLKGSFKEDKALADSLRGLSLSYWNMGEHEEAILYQRKLVLLLTKNRSQGLKKEKESLKIMLEKIKQ